MNKAWEADGVAYSGECVSQMMFRGGLRYHVWRCRRGEIEQMGREVRFRERDDA